MSHTQLTYTQAQRVPTVADTNPRCVREEQGEYNTRPFPDGFVRYSDVVDNKLPKARAVAWLLHEGALTDEQAIREAAFAIVDYIDDVLLAHKALYEQYVQYRDR